MKKIVAVMCLAVVLGTLAAAPVAAAELKTVVYAFDRKFAPFSFVRNQKPVGFEVEILEAVFKDSGFKIEYRPSRDWARTQSELSSGVVHLASGMTKSPLRERLFIYPDTPTVNLGLKFFVNRVDGMRTVGDLRGKTIAAVRDSLYQRLLQEFGGIRIKLFENAEQALEALHLAKVDAYFGADLMAYSLLERKQYKNLVVLGPTFRSTPMYYAFYKGHSDLRDFVNRGIKRLISDGTYDRIYRKWFVKELMPDEVTTLIEKAQKAARMSYAPGGGPVRGAAVLTHAGITHVGAVIGHADPKIGYEALEVALIKAINVGEMEMRAVVVVSEDGRVVVPSAKERMLLSEFGRGVLVLLEDETGKTDTWLLPRLLPFASVSAGAGGM